MKIHPLWYFCLFIRSSLILAIRYSKKNSTKYLNILIAIIGIGYWGKNYLRILNSLENTNLIAVVEPNPKIKLEKTKNYRRILRGS